MKQLFFILVICFFANKADAQQHWLMNADSIPNCDLIKTGKFINKITDSQSTPDYYLVYDDSTVTEYLNGGAYYVKSKITYESACKWKSEVVEVTIPDYDVQPGFIIHTEILTTSTVDNLIKIKVISAGEEYIFVLEKIE